MMGKEAKALGAKRLLILTDKGVLKVGLVNGVRKSLDEEAIEYDVFDGVVPEPTTESWELATKVVRAKKYDLIVGVGGGSTIDTSKATALGATNPEMPYEYVGRKFESPPLPMIIIPTTAGTGSEVTEAAGVEIEPKRKDFIWDPRLVPDISLVDPLMTISLPPKLTAETGFDALSHAMGAIMSKDANPVTDAEALKCIELVSKNLRIAYYNGDHLPARYGMMLAATLGGAAILNAGVALEHVLGQTFGPMFGVPHGLSCAISLPYSMEYNLPVIPEKFALVASAFGEDIRGLTIREAGMRAVQACRKLAEDVEIPLSLKEVNIPKDALEVMTDDIITGRARQDHGLDLNVRKTTRDSLGRKHLLDLFKRMWEGE